MTDDLTNSRKCAKLGAALDDDDLFSFHYERKGGIPTRRVICRIKDGLVHFKHPMKDMEVPIGYSSIMGYNLVLIIPLGKL